jgi:thiosulfate/3-mercaptopyruvate sulfurtransferase
VSEIELEELSARLDDAEPLAVLDVRTAEEYDGTLGYPCDPRQGHIPGARRVELAELVACASSEDVRQLVGLPEGAEVVAYCHSGSRSALAVQVLRAAGYSARNYAGSWHEWSRADLPAER